MLIFTSSLKLIATSKKILNLLVHQNDNNMANKYVLNTAKY